MRQAPRSPLSFKLQRVANVPEHPPPSTRLMSCAHIANRQLSRIIGARDDDWGLREGRYIERAPDWEPVESGSGIAYTALGHMNIHTWRLKVPGGWLYKVTERYELGHFIQLCFVPESQ